MKKILFAPIAVVLFLAFTTPFHASAQLPNPGFKKDLRSNNSVNNMVCSPNPGIFPNGKIISNTINADTLLFKPYPNGYNTNKPRIKYGPLTKPVRREQ
ncbi:MAG: hypothetical protein NTU44_05580 [Bacteroidetes bacterium]|nr:hypothetical protein [Bacteroidota bacterium]